MDDSDYRPPAAAAAPKSATPRPRKLWSLVWNDFTKDHLPDGSPIAVCNHCKKQLTASSRSGTTHLKNHLKVCIITTTTTTTTTNTITDGRRRKRRKHSVHRQPSSSAAPAPGTVDFTQEQTRNDLARMVLLHGYPLTMVADAGFKAFVRNLQPQFKMPSSDTLKEDCLRTYETERAKLYESLGKLTWRVNIMVGAWRPRYSEAEYVRVACRYVDESDWRIRSKILNVVNFDDLNAGGGISRVIAEKLYHWDVHGKLFSVVLDDFDARDDIAEQLLGFFRPKGVFLSNGEMFHLYSYEHVLNLMVHDGLAQTSDLISRVRESVKYLSSSPLSMRRFQEAAKQVNAPDKPIVLDVPSSWASTYVMLETACEFQDAFLDLRDCGSECSYLLSMNEWADVRAISECLDALYQPAKKFSAFAAPTANLYFVDVCGIHLLLKSWCTSQLPVVVSMASHIFKRFEEYWGMSRTVMAIASILDPRYKMKSVEYFFNIIYDGDNAMARIEEVHKRLTDLYNEYVVQAKHTSSGQALPCYTGSGHGSSSPQYHTDGVVKTPSRIIMSEARKGLDQYLQESSSSQLVKTDLDMYLEEGVHPPKELDENFNVLAWWKINAPRYPILSLMARDILAIPMSIVSLDTEGRWLDSCTIPVDSATMQSLVCAHDWLKDEIEVSTAGKLDADVYIPVNGDAICLIPQQAGEDNVNLKRYASTLENIVISMKAINGEHYLSLTEQFLHPCGWSHYFTLIGLSKLLAGMPREVKSSEPYVEASQEINV